MVAITVILAAVIGTFVLGLGDQVQETAPTAQFSWDEGDDEVSVTHQTGDSVSADQINITVDGTVVDPDGGGDDDDEIDGLEGRISAGSQITIPASAVDFEGDTVFEDGERETIRLVWETQGGERSDTLTSYTVSEDFGQ